MDMNISILAGRIAAEPEVRNLDSGTRYVKMLVSVRTELPRRRIDVIPVAMWDPSDDVVDSLYLSRGKPIWVSGSLQRRFWSADAGRISKLELVASNVIVGEPSKP